MFLTMDEEIIIQPELTPEQQSQQDIENAYDFQQKIFYFDEINFNNIKYIEEWSESLNKKIRITFLYHNIYEDDVLVGMGGNGIILKIIN